MAKIVNKICIEVVLQGLSEVIYFMKKAGLERKYVYNTVTQGAASSWKMINRFQTMCEDSFDFGFTVDWMRKDLGYCLDEAKNLNISLEIIKKYYDDLSEKNCGKWDTSSLLKRYL